MPLNVCSHCQAFFITKSLRCCVLSIFHLKLLNVGTLTSVLSDLYMKVSVDSQYPSLCHYMDIKSKLFKCHVQIAAGHTQSIYEGWNFSSGNYLFTTDTK